MPLLKVCRGVRRGHRYLFRIAVLVHKGRLDFPIVRNTNLVAEIELRVSLETFRERLRIEWLVYPRVEPES
jgi:hypothetical protein